MKLDSLPTEFKPYKQLEIAANKIIDGVALLSVSDFIPVLIGKGEGPEIWVSIPADQKGKEWQPLVRKNISLHESVNVMVKGNIVTVATPNEILLEIKEMTSENVEITTFNLRPFGINVILENGSLNVMTNRYSGNTVKDVKIFINIGSGAKPN